MAVLAARRWYLSVMAQHRRPRGDRVVHRCASALVKCPRQEVPARLTVLTTRSAIPYVLDRSTPGSWEPENTRLAQLHGFAV
jgi:hypothetical protein